MNSFGELLRKTRMRIAVTQEGLAVLSGIAAWKIDYFEQGRLFPKRGQLHSIIRALKLDEIDACNLLDRRNSELSRRHLRKGCKQYDQAQ